MPIRQLSFPCSKCSAITPHNQQTPNHVMHALLTLFLIGLWLPVWIIVAAIGPSAEGQCVSCGTRRKVKR